LKFPSHGVNYINLILLLLLNPWSEFLGPLYSEYNQLAMCGQTMPNRIGIYDTTLRDGEQTAGLVFNKYDKQEIAQALDEVGVERIEVGMPAVSEEDREAIKLIVADGLKAELWGFSRAKEQDIDLCIKLGLRNLLLEYPTSPYKIKAYGYNPEKVTNVIQNAVTYAKKLNAYVQFMFVDGTRTPREDLFAAMRAAVDAGADELTIPDTVGALSPEGAAYLVAETRKEFSLPLGIHVHNEFGMATACAMAAVRAGASWVHVTVNGLGEKSGNADISEIVVASRLLYGVESSIQLNKLKWLADKVEKISKVKLSSMKPVVGAAVFQRESGSVVNQMLKMPSAVESYDPSLVGQTRQIVLGKKSGKESLQHFIKSMKLSVSDEELSFLLIKIKQVSIERKGHVESDELPAMIQSMRERYDI
jgi:isopropylmalate/homocitrate/citramalate synthase